MCKSSDAITTGTMQGTLIYYAIHQNSYCPYVIHAVTGPQWRCEKIHKNISKAAILTIYCVSAKITFPLPHGVWIWGVLQGDILRLYSGCQSSNSHKVWGGSWRSGDATRQGRQPGTLLQLHGGPGQRPLNQGNSAAGRQGHSITGGHWKLRLLNMHENILAI